MFQRLLVFLFSCTAFLRRAAAFLFARFVFLVLGVAVLVLVGATASATTPVAGNVKNLGQGTVSAGTFVRFYLRGCAGNQPRALAVPGILSAIIAPTLGNVYYFDFVPDSTGAISGNLYSTRDATGVGPGDIECGGSLTAVWYGMQPYLNGKAGPETPVHANSGTTLNISTVIPITANPVVTAAVGLTQLTLPGSISGFTTVRASPVASGVLTLPAVTDTLVGQSTADTLFNKTLFAARLTGTTTTSTVFLNGAGLQLGATDTGLSRIGAGVTAFGNGTQGDRSGTVAAAKLTDDGAGNFYLVQNTAQAFNTYSGGVYTWSSTGLANGTKDTGLSRLAVGTVAVGNGTSGDASGTLKLASVSSPGADLALATTGDQFGTVRLHVRNRTGAGGVALENPSNSLADFAGQITAAITNIAIDGANNLTVTAVFASGGSTLPSVGQTVTLTGLTTATFLNNQVVTIATISATQFTASFTHAAYTSAPDTGTATLQINLRGEFRNDQVTAGNTSGEFQVLDPTNATNHWLAVGKSLSTFTGNVKAPTLTFPLQTPPPNPPSGSITIYGDTTSGQITCRNASGTSCFSATAAAPFISNTANPAQTGVLRAASGDTAVAFRNNANTADIQGLAKNTSDVVVVGGSAGISASGYQVNGSALSASNLSDGVTGSGAVVLQNNPVLGTATLNGTTTAATVNATSGYQVNGSALSASNLSNGLTGSGAVVLQNNPVLGHPSFSSGISNGSGLAIVSGSSCTTAAVANNACSTFFSWGVTFADTNYGAWCSLENQLAGSGAAFIVQVTNKSTTGANMVIQNAGPNATATQFSFWCIAIHP